MYPEVILFLLFSGTAFTTDFTIFHVDSFDKSTEAPETRSPKLVDIYTNHDDLKEVLENYRGDITRSRNSPKFGRIRSRLQGTNAYSGVPLSDIIPHSRVESTDLDRIDFHYPSMDHVDDIGSDFGTIVNPVDEQYVFLQSQKVAAADGEENSDLSKNRRPKFKTQKYVYDKSYSYIQKIPKLNITSSSNSNINKIEEEDLSDTKKTVATKNRINALLKRYLTRLYSQKFNNTATNPTAPGSVSKFSYEPVSTEEPKTKLLDTDSLWNLKNKTANKINKLFSLFTIVKFNHTECNATSSSGTYQGTCYTSSECSSMGGTAMGDCASGYGVCCVFKGSCGDSASQNCSYFESPNYPNYYPSDGAGGGVVVPTTIAPTTENPSPTPDPRLPWYYRSRMEPRSNDALSCIFNVYKVNDNISKMRIDFLDLELTGPTNGTCVDERLVISGQNANNQVPVICGYNTGQHVYVDVSSLSGPLQLSVLSTMNSRKRFKIRICQYEDSCMEPSSNCLQYYTGVMGVISSFNYDQASMFSRSMPGYFNNLNYAICIRREEGYCSITYRNVMNGVEYPFQLRNVDNSGNPTVDPGQAGADVINCPDDYIVIGNTRLCGDKFNDGTTVDDFTMNAEVTDTGAGPIVIPVRSDSMNTGLGFKLFYTQNPCTTTY